MAQVRKKSIKSTRKVLDKLPSLDYINKCEPPNEHERGCSHKSFKAFKTVNYGKIKVFNLGTELDQASFYVDYAMSKRELAAAMEASRNSVIKWANIAWSCSSDFRKDTPQGEDGSYNRNAALTPYQVWLVSRIQLMMQRLKNSNRTKGYIKSNNDFFDKSRFEHLDHIVRKRWNEYYINAS